MQIIFDSTACRRTSLSFDVDRGVNRHLGSSKNFILEKYDKMDKEFDFVGFGSVSGFLPFLSFYLFRYINQCQNKFDALV